MPVITKAMIFWRELQIMTGDPEFDLFISAYPNMQLV